MLLPVRASAHRERAPAAWRAATAEVDAAFLDKQGYRSSPRRESTLRRHGVEREVPGPRLGSLVEKIVRGAGGEPARAMGTVRITVGSANTGEMPVEPFASP